MIYNLGHSICRLFDILAQFLFPKRETELDFHHQKVNVGAASRAAERLKTLGHFKENHKMLSDGKYPDGNQKAKF